VGYADPGGYARVNPGLHIDAVVAEDQGIGWLNIYLIQRQLKAGRIGLGGGNVVRGDDGNFRELEMLLKLSRELG
jgi:hypothetical protein